MNRSNRFLTAVAALSALSFGALQARADDAAPAKSATEFFYQAASGTSDAGVHIGYEGTQTTDKNGNKDAFSGVNRFGVGYEYGLNSMLAVGADIAYTSFNGDVKVNGLNNLSIYLKGNWELGGGHLRYGLGLGVPLQQGKETSDDSQTTSLSRFEIIPYLGYDMNLSDTGIVGARILYNYAATHKFELEDGTKVDMKGDDSFDIAVFYECLANSMLYGVALDYTAWSAMSFNGVTAVDSHNQFGINLYSRIPVMGSLDLVPNISYKVAAGGFYTTNNVIDANILARYSF